MTTTTEQMREFIAEIAEQTPEKPDYWNSCGQCQSNIDKAQELREAAPAPQELIAACDRALCHFERIRGDKEDTALMICLRRALSNALSRSNAPQPEADSNAPWLSLAHLICADAGIAPGHIQQRLETLRDKLEAAPVAIDDLKQQNAELVKDAERWQELLKQHNSIIGESLTVFLDKEDGSLDPVADLKSTIDAAIASAHQEINQ